MITVGVPVYNGGSLLEESLACLSQQDHDDFVVLIHDNCSTDQTPEIARRFCERDPRFRYHRHPSNIGPTANFIAVMEAAQTPYFIWRAHDDLSAVNYLSELGSVLAAAPEAGLAASRVIRERLRPDGTTSERVVPYRPYRGANRIERIANGVGTLHQSWVYGLWRTDALRAVRRAVLDRYPHPWAGDFLMLFHALTHGGIVGSDKTWFRQRIIEKPSQDPGQAAPQTYRALRALREEFSSICLDIADASSLAPPQRRELSRIVERFTSRRVGSRRRLARLWLSDALHLRA